MQKLFFFFFTLLVYTNSLVAQQDTTVVVYDISSVQIKEITDKDLKRYKQDSSFNYEIEKKEKNTWVKDIKAWFNNILHKFFKWLFGAEKAVGALSFFLRIIPYLLLVVLIFILIKFFINTNIKRLNSSKKNQNIVSLSEEEQIIKNENIEELITNAVAKKNYRLAIRYYYLLILKLMSEKKIINWELQKTNNDYINEINKIELRKKFTHITRLYNYIWYGDFPINELKYKIVALDFTNLQKTIIKNG